MSGKWSAALSRDDNRFFAERCYLAQSTLTRLLEIYQTPADPKAASPLTRFVSELLRIDRHDALVDGLYPALHLARLKKLIPGYNRALDRQTQLRPQVATQTMRTATDATEVQESLQAVLARAGRDGYDGPTDSIDALESWLTNPRNADASNRLTAAGQQLDALVRRWASVAHSSDDQDREAAERQANETAALLAAWRIGLGADLDGLIGRLQSDFPNLSSPLVADPKKVYDEATSAVGDEVDRCAARLVADQQSQALLLSASAQVANVQARISSIDSQLADFAGEFQGLASALAGLLPHIAGSACPVCDRDFVDVSDQPLATHVASKIAGLTERAERLQRLNQTRVEAAEDLIRAQQEQALHAVGVMNRQDRSLLEERLATLTDARRLLAELADAALTGSQLLQSSSRAAAAVAALRESNQELEDIRRSTAVIRLAVEEAEPESVDLGSELRTLQSTVGQRLAAIEAVRVRTELLLNDLRVLRRRQLDLADAQRQLEVDGEELSQLNVAIAEINRRREAARRVSTLATNARTDIVRQVFNESLNQVWRDLFVRLAPGEPYVPQFKVPRGSAKALVAQLETVHRAGDPGGTPAAMLSAGNLNTAALTLFLALHLTAPRRVPLLLLDDPVQSMDDVHVAQFAALLRTLSKACDRQVVVAVHDRTLFDYLTLELSPAEQSDKLITIELSRLASGESLAIPEIYRWREDTVFGAA